MDDILLYALGGLGEDGKNLYCIEIKNNIYIIDAGLQYPSIELYGIDLVIPDISYLIENKDRIKAIFLSHGHESQIGAVPKILTNINIPIYGTNFTLAVLKDLLHEQKMDHSKFKFNKITSDSRLKFDGFTVSFFQTTHSIPESVGISFNTEKGSIVYATDYTFDQNVDKLYQTSYSNITDISKKKVLCLLTESLGAERPGHTNSDQSLDFVLEDAFYSAEGRIIVSLFSTDISRIQRVVNVAIKNNKELVILGRKTQRLVDIAVKLGYLEIPKEKLKSIRFIDEKNKNELTNSVILVTGERHEPYYMLYRMCKKQDRLIHINKKDTIILMTSPVPGTEKISARTKDELYKVDANVISINKDLLPTSHASKEDVKLMVNLLKPQYIIPVTGEYRHQYALVNTVKAIDYKDENIFLLNNGDILTFKDDSVEVQISKIKIDELLIDGNMDDNLHNVVIRDRELLAEDGVLLIVGNVDARKKKLLCKPEVVSRGFLFMKENNEIIEKIQSIFALVTEKHMKTKYIDWRVYKEDVRSEISKYLYKETKRRPIIIPIIIDTQKK